MMDLQEFTCGALTVGLAQGASELKAIQKLRAERFRNSNVPDDLDKFDRYCAHLMIRHNPSGEALATARFRLLASRDDMQTSYAAQFYDFSELFTTGVPILELGRLCISGAHKRDPDIMRAMLAALTRIVTTQDVAALIGCTSFKGADMAMHRDALQFLSNRHIGPAHLQPARRAKAAVALPPVTGAAPEKPPKLPPLLRMYLALGGWVSDHAVCDPDLDTVHVFTAVEVGNIPASRLRALQALVS